MRSTSRLPLASAALLTLSSAALCQGADDCAAPQPISGTGSFPFNTAGASTTGQDFGGMPCEVTMNEDVFFVWTAMGSGNRDFSLCSATHDTQLQLASGVDCSAVCVANNDDWCGDQSLVRLPVTSGDTYVVNVGGWAPGDVGVGLLDVTVSPPAPANDTCATPTAISGFGTFTYDSAGSSDSGFQGGAPGTCQSLLNQPLTHDLFFLWTAAGPGDVAFETAGSLGNPEISLHLGSDCSATCLDHNLDGVGIDPEARVIVPGVVAGTDYLVQVGQWQAGMEGPGTLLVLSWTTPAPPANDTCATATAISGTGSFPYDRTWATTSGFDGGDPVLCAQNQSLSALRRDIFWQWTATSAGDFSFDNCGAATDTILNGHLGTGCAAVCTLTNDLAPCAFIHESQITILGVAAGDTWLIQLGDWDNEPTLAANGALRVINATPPPVNNDCASATAISGFGNFLFDTLGATTSGFNAGAAPCLTPGVDGGVEGDVFHQWTATVAGDVQIDTIGSGVLDDLLQVHVGVGCSATCLIQDDNGGGNFDSRVVLTGVAAGDTYLIQNGSWQLIQAGVGALNIFPPPPPPANDTCAAPLVISGTGPFGYDTSNATSSGFDGGVVGTCTDTQNLVSPPSGDLFYVWTAPCDGAFTVHNCGSGDDTTINVHLGSDCSATCLAGSNGAVTNCVGAVESEVEFIATGGADYLIQVGGWSTFPTTLVGAFVVEPTGVPCGGGNLTLTCDPASPHYLGGAADLSSSSLAAATSSGLHLDCTDGPPGEFGFFLVSADASVTLPVFNGTLCLGGPQGRYNPLVATNQGLSTLNSLGQFDAAGVLQNLAGTAPSSGGSGFDVPSELPFTPPGQQIQSGQTWYFQCWYRDQVPPLPNPGSSANFSNVLGVTF